CLLSTASVASTYTYLSSFTGPAPPQTYTLSLHDALPIYRNQEGDQRTEREPRLECGHERRLQHPQHGQSGQCGDQGFWRDQQQRSEEHTSELQSHLNLVCRLLLEKKKKIQSQHKRDREGC